ncbi:MAG: TetR/AcrR family transcriptional regulator [Methylocystaceae bacterium]
MANNKGGKDIILDAARTVIARNGVNNASVQAIADEAGLSKGAVYYHFKNKDHILYEMIDQFLRTAIAPVKYSLNSSGDYQELKKGILSGVLQRLEGSEHNRLQFYLTHEAILGNEEMHDRLVYKYNGWVDTTEKVMNRMYATPPSKLNRALAATMIAAIDGQVIQLLLEAKVVTIEELMELWEVLIETGVPELLTCLLETKGAREQN